MLRKKTLLLFLLQVILLYGLLSLPFSFYDEIYGNFYRKGAGIFFGKFRETGFVWFKPGEQAYTTRITIANTTQIDQNGSVECKVADINTRYLGYIPTILIISLVLASPVPWKRKLAALAAGFILVTLLIMFKQWISLLWYCKLYPSLQLTDFSSSGNRILTFFNTFICDSASSVLYFVVAIWLLVTFRVEDFRKK